MTDLETIEYIKDEMLVNNLKESFVYNVVFLAYDNDECFQLLLEWMRHTDPGEREVIQSKMMILLNKFNRLY